MKPCSYVIGKIESLLSFKLFNNLCKKDLKGIFYLNKSQFETWFLKTKVFYTITYIKDAKVDPI